MTDEQPKPYWTMLYCLLAGYTGGLFCQAVEAPTFLGFICAYVCATQIVAWALKSPAKKAVS